MANGSDKTYTSFRGHSMISDKELSETLHTFSAALANHKEALEQAQTRLDYHIQSIIALQRAALAQNTWNVGFVFVVVELAAWVAAIDFGMVHAWVLPLSGLTVYGVGRGVQRIAKLGGKDGKS